MIRGTTPTHTFTLPISVDDVDKIRIIYAQGGVKIIKTNADCTMEGKTVTTTLTQEDTLSLSSDTAVQIQLRVLTREGEALVSDVYRIRPGVCLEDEVIE